LSIHDARSEKHQVILFHIIHVHGWGPCFAQI